MNNKKINIRVEYEPTPIRHCSIQCPSCDNWFWDYDICKEKPSYSHELNFIRCKCPKCTTNFEAFNISGYNNLQKTFDTNIEEVGYSSMKNIVLEKKTTWE